MRWRYLLLIFVVVFAATLAVIVGESLSPEAMSMMVGVAAGVGASLPASLLIVWLAARSAQLRAVPVAPAACAPEPPEHRLVVVHAPARHPAPAGEAYAAYGAEAPMEAPYRPALPPPARRRQFTVVGAVAEPEGLLTGEAQYEAATWRR